MTLNAKVPLLIAVAGVSGTAGARAHYLSPDGFKSPSSMELPSAATPVSS